MASLTIKELTEKILETVKYYISDVISEVSQNQVKIVYLTQSEYDSLTQIDENTLYVIV